MEGTGIDRLDKNVLDKVRRCINIAKAGNLYDVGEYECYGIILVESLWNELWINIGGEIRFADDCKEVNGLVVPIKTKVIDFEGYEISCEI